MVKMGTQEFTKNNSDQKVTNNNNNNNNSSNKVNNESQNGLTTKPIIERGASWSFNETKILLALWSQDMVQRQLTNSKRTKHVWEKISERIREHGYDRTPDQVRTRVFNMIAEYRRIIKNPTPERRKKCIFFDALHRIYQSKDSNNFDGLILSYNGDDSFNFDPIEFNNDDVNNETNNGNEDDYSDQEELFAFPLSPNGIINSEFDNQANPFDDTNNDLQSQSKRGRFEDYISCKNNLSSLAPHTSSALDTSSSALLIDRMFTHLSRETEVLREWVNLERERLAQEVARRKEEKEREDRRVNSFIEILTKFQEQFLSILKQNNSSNKCCSSSNLSQEEKSIDEYLDHTETNPSAMMISNNDENEVSNTSCLTTEQPTIKTIN
ncbi:hypothetical protein NH340_JMT03950 [Sarcoptes scabiei]|nr:hypothetical protein NH340_JMT03950 [Sarcoptes scabiei]